MRVSGLLKTQSELGEENDAPDEKTNLQKNSGDILVGNRLYQTHFDRIVDELTGDHIIQHKNTLNGVKKKNLFQIIYLKLMKSRSRPRYGRAICF